MQPPPLVALAPSARDVASAPYLTAIFFVDV